MNEDVIERRYAHGRRREDRFRDYDIARRGDPGEVAREDLDTSGIADAGRRSGYFRDRGRRN